MIVMKLRLSRWQTASIVLVAIYVSLVYVFLPLSSLAISETFPLAFDRNLGGFTVNGNVSNSVDRDFFLVGDLAVFSFNITNTYGQPATFDYNSSVTFSQYGWPQSFTLNSYDSKNITEELPLNSEGSNGFLFHVVGKANNSVDDLAISLNLKAISISEEISLVSQKSTFILTMIIGIPAIVYGVKEFRELGKKNPLQR